MKKDVPASSGEFDFEIRTSDGRLNVEKFAVGLNYVLERTLPARYQSYS